MLRQGDAVGAYALLTRGVAARVQPASLLLRKRADLALLLDAHELALQDLRVVDARGEASADDLLKLGLSQQMLGHLRLAASAFSRASDTDNGSELLRTSVLSLESKMRQWSAALESARANGAESAADWLLAAMRLDNRDEAMMAIGRMSGDREELRASESWISLTTMIWFGDVEGARSLLAQSPKWPNGVADIGMALVCRELGEWVDARRHALRGFDWVPTDTCLPD